jgi:hypothetical protein
MWLPILKFAGKIFLEFGGGLVAELAAKKTANWLWDQLPPEEKYAFKFEKWAEPTYML